jgi:hypothetical protein
VTGAGCPGHARHLVIGSTADDLSIAGPLIYQGEP